MASLPSYGGHRAHGGPLLRRLGARRENSPAKQREIHSVAGCNSFHGWKYTGLKLQFRAGSYRRCLMEGSTGPGQHSPWQCLTASAVRPAKVNMYLGIF